MMKNIQEKRIDNELALIKNLSIKTQIKKFNKEDYYITVTIPNNMIDYIEISDDVNIVIHIGANFPLNAPKVYVKTPFCFPHFCDGRDILEDVLSQTWNSSFSIVDIINKMPEFFSDFLKKLKQGVLILVGNYYLGEKYDLSLLESLPVFIKKVKEKVIIDNKEKEFPKIMMVSDIFFCLFDQEKWTKNNLHLTFWSNIRSLVTIKKLIKGDTCRFFWKQKNKNQNYEMILSLEDSNTLINLMLEKMSKFGINYKLSKHNLGPKQGVIPAIDIDSVEKAIGEVEARVEDSPDMELVQYLMSLYEKAVEFYSATNDPRYEYYRQKIHATLTSPRVDDFLHSSRSKNESTEITSTTDDHIDFDIKFKNAKENENIIEDKKFTNEEIAYIKKNNDQPESTNKDLNVNLNLDLKKDLKSIDYSQSDDNNFQREGISTNQVGDSNMNEAALLKDKTKLIYHVPYPEENIVEPTRNELKAEIITNINTREEDKTIKNERMGVKLVLVNDDDEEQKVSISDDDESEEDDEDDE